MDKQLTCADRVNAAKTSRLDDLKLLLTPVDEDSFETSYRDGEPDFENAHFDFGGFRQFTFDISAHAEHVEGDDCDIHNIDWTEVCSEFEDDVNEELRNAYYEYGLAFDYVIPDDAEKDAYFRYQISYGGPSEELRFYCDASYRVYKIEFVLLDWFDGAPLTLHGDDRATAQMVFDDFKDCDMLKPTVEKALADL